MAKGSLNLGYTVSAVAKLLGLTQERVRSYVREGFVSPRRGARGEHLFSLQDVVLLRTAKELTGRLPLRKVRNALRRLRLQLPQGRALTAVRITADGDRVVVQDDAGAWEAESGQTLLNFEVADLAKEIAPLARRAAKEAFSTGKGRSAEAWYELGCDLEAVAMEQARDAYRRALELEPDHADARINLGRLLHESGETEAAERHYRLALESSPENAIAAFNLGVVLQDLGRPREAVDAYERAIVSDACCADAHFNLARLYERLGQKTAAFRHLKAYRQIEQGA